MAAGQPEPAASVARDYGETGRRPKEAAAQVAAMGAAEGKSRVGPTLGEIRLRGAIIPLINNAVLREIAAEQQQQQQQPVKQRPGHSGAGVAAIDAAGRAAASHPAAPAVSKRGGTSRRHTLTLIDH